jgi:hypothetical protein
MRIYIRGMRGITARIYIRGMRGITARIYCSLTQLLLVKKKYIQHMTDYKPVLSYSRVRL